MLYRKRKRRECSDFPSLHPSKTEKPLAKYKRGKRREKIKSDHSINSEAKTWERKRRTENNNFAKKLNRKRKRNNLDIMARGAKNKFYATLARYLYSILNICVYI
ncbi:unnamed protein product [Meloidogyne enterolobii]|uniref:Uncharacterized protein n=1 Tax=Meloidogyne enterolobii TaxID=390850 RepID=A0ACB0YL86_MELEN